MYCILCDMGKINVIDIILIKNLGKQKRWDSKRLLKEFPSKDWSRSGLDSLLSRIEFEHLCLLPWETTDTSEYLLLRTIEYLMLEAAQTTWYKMLSFLSWCTCKITVLFLRMKRFIDRAVEAYFFGPPYIHNSIQDCKTSSPLAARLSWLERAYSRPLMGGFFILIHKAGQTDLGFGVQPAQLQVSVCSSNNLCHPG